LSYGLDVKATFSLAAQMLPCFRL